MQRYLRELGFTKNWPGDKYLIEYRIEYCQIKIGSSKFLERQFFSI